MQIYFKMLAWWRWQWRRRWWWSGRRTRERSKLKVKQDSYFDSMWKVLPRSRYTAYGAFDWLPRRLRLFFLPKRVKPQSLPLTLLITIGSRSWGCDLRALNERTSKKNNVDPFCMPKGWWNKLKSVRSSRKKKIFSTYPFLPRAQGIGILILFSDAPSTT